MATYLFMLDMWLHAHPVTIDYSRAITIGRVVITSVTISPRLPNGIQVLGGYYKGVASRYHLYDITMFPARSANEVRAYYDWYPFGPLFPYREAVWLNISDILAGISYQGSNMKDIVYRYYHGGFNYLSELRYQMNTVSTYNRVYTKVGIGPAILDTVTVSTSNTISISDSVYTVTGIDYQGDRIHLRSDKGTTSISGYSILHALPIGGTNIADALHANTFWDQGSSISPPPSRRRGRYIVGTPGYTLNPRDDGSLVCLIGNRLSPCP